MWRLEPPRKKRRLSHTMSLDLYNFQEGDEDRDERLARTVENMEIVDPEALLPPAPKIPNVVSAAYDDYLQALPLNIIFQARITNNQLTSVMYPSALVGESVRLYYPDHKTFNSLLHEGILRRLGVSQRDAVRTLKLVAKKAGEVVFTSEFMCFEAQWEAALMELAKKGVGKKGEGGLRNADSVRLLVGLDCETY